MTNNLQVKSISISCRPLHHRHHLTILASENVHQAGAGLEEDLLSGMAIFQARTIVVAPAFKLADALDAMLTGMAIETASTKAIGCSIKFTN